MSTFDAKTYWEERLRANYSVCGVGHMGLGKHYNDWLYKVRRQVFFRTVNKLSLPWRNTEVMDVGSGTGFYIDCWKALQVKTIVGSDLTQIAVNNLMQRFPNDKFLQLDIGDEIDISTVSTFQVISAFDVLFHIADDTRYQRALKNIYNLLQPGGYFIFSDNFLHRLGVRAPQEVDRSLDEIQEMIKTTGFQIIQRTPMFVLMNFPVDSSSKLRQFLWRAMLVPVKITDLYGYMLGATLYPIELFLTKHLQESPATEIMICKKIAQ